MDHKRKLLISWGILILLALIWGSSFILIKKALLGFSPVQVGALRIFISFLALSPLLFVYFKKIPKKKLPLAALVGLFGSGLPPFLFALAQMEVSSSVTGILNSTTPLFAFLLGVFFFSVEFRWIKLTGIITGLAGVLMLILQSTGSLAIGKAHYPLFVILATISYGLNVNLIKRHFQTESVIAISVVAFVWLGIPAGALLFSTDFIDRLQGHPHAWESLGYISILAVVGTAFATVIFFYLTQLTTALFSSTVTYLIPVIAIGWGWLDAEPVSWWHIAGLVLILTGVYLAGNRKKPEWRGVPGKSGVTGAD